MRIIINISTDDKNCVGVGMVCEGGQEATDEERRFSEFIVTSNRWLLKELMHEIGCQGQEIVCNKGSEMSALLQKRFGMKDG